MQRLQSWSTYIGALGVAMLVAALLLFIISDIPRNVLLLFGGIGVVLIAFYFITRPRDETRQASNVRIASQGANVLLIAVAVIGIVGAINYIANRQFKQRFDVTANQEHTLSSQTVQVLGALQEQVKVTGFFTPDTLQQRQEAEKLLKDYQAKSDKLVVQYVDPDENPTLALKYDNALPGTVVFENSKGDRTEKVYNAGENSFTNAILKVTQTQQPAIYFTSGQGELLADNFDTNGLGAVVDMLKQLNYKVQPLNLVTISSTLPADTRALVIAGATKPFSAESEKLIQNYLDNGGRVMLLAHPNSSVGLTDTLKTWGLVLENNLVLDPARNYLGNAPVPVFLQFPESPVTLHLDQYGVFFPGARAISETNSTDKMATALFTTTDQSCAKSDFEKLQQPQQIQCEASDAKGPFVVGYALEGAGSGANPDQHARLLVIGNAAFATNQWMTKQDSLGNQQLFVNAIHWLAGQEQLIAIPPRDPNTRPLTTMTGTELNLVAGTSIILIPLAALVIGILLWWKRR
ncbi:MAG: Gldg family protein [Chloroflexi bacterium]|nr:Gldg family protein [Chloroflexota bacterium]